MSETFALFFDSLVASFQITYATTTTTKDDETGTADPPRRSVKTETAPDAADEKAVAGAADDAGITPLMVVCDQLAVDCIEYWLHQLEDLVAAPDHTLSLIHI